MWGLFWTGADVTNVTGSGAGNRAEVVVPPPAFGTIKVMMSRIRNLRSPRSPRSLPFAEHRAALDALFPGVTDAELATLAANTTMVSRPAGASLCRQGALGQEAMVVLDGGVTVTVTGEPVAQHSAPTVIGELALTGEMPYRTADVVARDDVTVLVLSRSEFSCVLSGCPHIAATVDALSTARRPDSA